MFLSAAVWSQFLMEGFKRRHGHGPTIYKWPYLENCERTMVAINR